MTAPFSANRAIGGGPQIGGRVTGPMGGAYLVDTEPSLGLAFSDHFAPYRSGDWTITNVGAGSAIAQSATEISGAITITPDGTTNHNGSQAQLNGGWFRLRGDSSDMRLRHSLGFRARLKIADVDKSTLFVGFAVTDTTIMATGEISLTQGFGLYMSAATLAAVPSAVSLFYKPDAIIAASVRHGLIPLVNAEYIEIAARLDSTGDLVVFANDEAVYSERFSVLPDTHLRLSFASHNLDTPGAANVSTWDYIQASDF